MVTEYTFGLWSRFGRQRIYINDGRRQVGWYDPVTGEKGIREAESEEVHEALAQFADRIAGAPVGTDEPATYHESEDGLTGPADVADNRPGDLVPGDGWKANLGIEGELQTAGVLTSLHHRGFRTLHSIELIGTEKDIDHLVIGPTGVFTINSKKTSYPVVVEEDGTAKVHGYRQTWLADADRDARIVTRRLSESTGLELEAEGLVSVWNGDHPIEGFHQQVVPGDEIVEALAQRHPLLTSAAVDIAYGIARLPRTWA